MTIEPKLLAAYLDKTLSKAQQQTVEAALCDDAEALDTLLILKAAEKARLPKIDEQVLCQLKNQVAKPKSAKPTWHWDWLTEVFFHLTWSTVCAVVIMVGFQMGQLTPINENNIDNALFEHFLSVN